MTFRGQTGYVVGEFGTMFKTTDGGTTWNPVTLENKVSLMAIDFRTDNDGVAVGLAGTLMTTSDGGATWTLIPDLTREHLFDVHWYEDKWVVVGDKGVMITSDAGAKNWTVGKIFEGDIAWRTQMVKAGAKSYVVGANLGILEGGKLSIVGR